MDAPLEVVEKRDPKGLYQKARSGEIKGKCKCTNLPIIVVFMHRTTMLSLLTYLSFSPFKTEFTGISAPYEAPTSPEIHIRTDKVDVAGAVQIIVEYLEKEGIIAKA